MPQSIFISHAKKDKTIIDYFIDDILINGLGFSHSDIFCTSTDGMGIKPGKDWRKEIKDKIVSAKIVFLIITPNYQESEMCQNELGAAWIANDNVIPMIIEPATYSTAGATQEPKQIEQLTRGESLDNVKDVLAKLFPKVITGASSANWTRKKREFVTKVKQHLEKNPYKEPVNRENFEKLQSEYKELQSDFDAVVEEKMQLQQMINDLKQVKDAAKVREIEIMHGIGSNLEDFWELVEKLKKSMKGISPVIVTLIYNDFSKNDLEIDFQLYKADLKRGEAEKMINSDLEVRWDHPKMRIVESTLIETKTFFEKTLSNGDFEELESKYPSEPLQFSALSFWENVMDIRMDHL